MEAEQSSGPVKKPGMHLRGQQAQGVCNSGSWLKKRSGDEVWQLRNDWGAVGSGQKRVSEFRGFVANPPTLRSGSMPAVGAGMMLLSRGEGGSGGYPGKYLKGVRGWRGVWCPKIWVPKMARQESPDGKLRFFPPWPL